MKYSVVFVLCILLLAGCGPHFDPATPALPAVPGLPSIPSGLTRDQFTTLQSLKKVDDYPLYTMNYLGIYPQEAENLSKYLPGEDYDPVSSWACSLFTVLLDKDNLLFGRNFDWQFSPAVLLFTDPPDGYAAVSMVDIAYLGFDVMSARGLMDLPIRNRTRLLDAPFLPFDGMNECGFAIGMAAVPPGNMQPDANKETIGSLRIIRQILDRACNVDEAIEIMKIYNIDFSGGPPLHYLMADATGRAILVEFYDGKMHILGNDQPWHIATNFLRSSVDDPAEGGCWRYDKIDARLSDSEGQLDTRAALNLLADVAQNNTQWSIVYQMSSGLINIAMGQQYRELHQFQLDSLGR